MIELDDIPPRNQPDSKPVHRDQFEEVFARMRAAEERNAELEQKLTEAVAAERAACAASLWEELPEIERKHIRKHHRNEMEWRKQAAAIIEARGTRHG